MSNIQTGAERMPHDLSHLGFLAGQIGRLITISTTPVIAGDSFEMDVVGGLRLSPLRHGLASDYTVDIFTFYVPHRHVYGEQWIKFMKDGVNANPLPTVNIFFSSRRRHTRFKCDWSSDVCSYDLPSPEVVLNALLPWYVEDPALHIPRQHGIQHDLGRRLEFVDWHRYRRQLRGLLDLQRQQPPDDRLLGQHGDEPCVDDVNLVHAAVVSRPGEGIEQRRGDLAGVPLRRDLGETAPLACHLPLAEPVPADALAPGNVGHGLDAAALKQGAQPLRLAQHAGVEAAAEATVAGQDQDRRTGRVGRLAGQRVVDLRRTAHHGLDGLGELACVGPSVAEALLGPDNP